MPTATFQWGSRAASTKPNQALRYFRSLVGSGTGPSRAADWLFYGFPHVPRWAVERGFSETEREHLVKALRRLTALL